MKRVVFLSLLILVAAAALSALDDIPPPSSREVPPAPVVSDLRAVVDGKTVTLSWTPAPDITGNNIILRSARPITASNFAEAEKIGTVPSTVTTFTDSIESGKEYYYAILSKDSNGMDYKFFLPSSNSLLVAVADASGRKETIPAVISAFGAITRDDAVILTWTSSEKSKNVIIYRSTTPFSDMTSLVQAVVVSSFSDSGIPYVDYPVPGVPYYYAILDENVVRSGTASFTAGENTNGIPVEIPAIFLKIQKTGLPSLRPMPLPWLNPSSGIPPVARKLSPGTEKMVRALVSEMKPAVKNEHVPYIFRSDLESVSGGEEYTLKKILETGFLTGSWNTAITDLTRFLAIRRTPETTARTRFYLGEAYYFSKNYHQALLEFLLSRDLYYNQANEWIQYALDNMI